MLQLFYIMLQLFSKRKFVRKDEEPKMETAESKMQTEEIANEYDGD